MKKLILMIPFLIICTTASAFYYIVNTDNVVIGRSDYQPDQSDLQLRNEITVFSNADISLDQAEYRNGKIVVHTKTASEIAAEQAIVNKHNADDLLRASAGDKLRALGLTEAEINAMMGH